MLAKITRRLDDFVHRAENAFLAAVLASILGIMLASIGGRYLLNSPLVWSEEALLIAFVWLIFVAAAASFRDRAHVRVDLLLLLLPRRVKIFLSAVGVILVFATMGVLAFSTIEYLDAVRSNRTPLLGIPVGYVFAVIPLSMVCAALHIIRNIIDDGLQHALASTTEAAGT